MEFAFSPLISILVPAYETPELFLRQMIDSVLQQSYGRLELCIADGSPSDGGEADCGSVCPKDSRVRYRKLDENLGFQEIQTRPSGKRSGPTWAFWITMICFFQGALFEIVRALNDGEPADAVYTDEDKLDPERNCHFQPHFKPDFNGEYLRSNNYICISLW